MIVGTARGNAFGASWVLQHPVGGSVPSGIQVRKEYAGGPPRCSGCRAADVEAADARASSEHDESAARLIAATEAATTPDDLDRLGLAMEKHADAARRRFARGSDHHRNVVLDIGPDRFQQAVARCLRGTPPRCDVVTVEVHVPEAWLLARGSGLKVGDRIPVWPVSLKTGTRPDLYSSSSNVMARWFLVDATGRCWRQRNGGDDVFVLRSAMPIQAGAHRSVVVVEHGVAPRLSKRRSSGRWNWFLGGVEVEPTTLSGERFSRPNEASILR